MSALFDIAVIGGGVVGTAIVRELSCYDISCVLIEKNSDVGAGTSKGNSAILHTGFDAPPGSLESRLMRRSYERFHEIAGGLNIAIEHVGALLVAWDKDQVAEFPKILKKAHENGVTDVAEISVQELRKRVPELATGALAAIEVPGESIIDPFTPIIAFATQAALNGIEIMCDSPVLGIRTDEEGIHHIKIPSGEINAQIVINAAGLYSDEIDRMFGHDVFHVRPRKGEFVIYDKVARPLVNHILLPIPTEKTKGMLVCPTVFGNLLAGPTADDQDDKTDTRTTADGLARVRENAERVIPKLQDLPVTSTYAGLRAATEHRDYQIHFYDEQLYITVGGIRSTGLTGSLGIAEYVLQGLFEMGIRADKLRDFPKIDPPGLHNLGEAFTRPCRCEEKLKDADYGRMVCHCERVSRGEIRDAFRQPLPAKDIDSLRRRTRATMGRCQGFHCQADIAALVAEATGKSIEEVLNQEPQNEC